MKRFVLLLLLAGVALTQGCLLKQDDAKASPTSDETLTLRRDLDAARTQTKELNVVVGTLQQQLTDAQRDLGSEKMHTTGLQAENEKLEAENMRLAKIVLRLDPTAKQTKLWTRAELEKALIGQTKAEIQKVLGAPTASYGTASPFLKYSRVCLNPATGKVDEFVQLNFEANVLKSVVY